MLPAPALAVYLLAFASAFDDELLPPAAALEFAAVTPPRVDDRSI